MRNKTEGWCPHEALYKCSGGFVEISSTRIIVNGFPSASTMNSYEPASAAPSLSTSLSLSPSLSVSLYLSVSLSLLLSPFSVSMSLAFELGLSVSVSVSLCFSRCLSLCISLCPCLPLFNSCLLSAYPKRLSVSAQLM